MSMTCRITFKLPSRLQSAHLRERAYAEARFIADHAGALELRETFLSRPERS